METKIILISGKQGSGKTTLQKSLVGNLNAYDDTAAFPLNFAGPIYKMHDFCVGYLKTLGIKRDMVKDGPLLQLLGTEWGRKTISENVWVEAMRGQIAKVNVDYGQQMPAKVFAIVGDCRFRNELAAFPEALKIRLECNAGVRRTRCEQWRDNDMHASEIDLDGQLEKFDLVFDTGHFSVAAMIAQIMAKLEIK